MPTFIMLTRLSPGTNLSPSTLETMEKEAMKQIRAACPQVEWLQSFAVLGPYDYVDIFRAPDTEAATKVSTLIRAFGHATTEVWAATEWERFKAILRELPANKAGAASARL
jgi:uncharacterized protein with GYD domain